VAAHPAGMANPLLCRKNNNLQFRLILYIIKRKVEIHGGISQKNDEA